MKTTGFEDIKKVLLQKKSLILKTDRNIDKEIKKDIESRHGDDVDVAESAYEQEMAYLFKSRGKDELRLIDEALKRIDQGEYGICAECDEKISKKRLAAQPYSILCVQCQEEVEKAQAGENPAIKS
ncbi:MAG: TraR/DksA family transcriptional regulator [Nitrospinota bacterium]|nr:TraR/DksA family transcriptional regulator [Nitrospinota bacterium]